MIKNLGIHDLWLFYSGCRDHIQFLVICVAACQHKPVMTPEDFILADVPQRAARVADQLEAETHEVETERGWESTSKPHDVRACVDEAGAAINACESVQGW